MLKYQNAFSGFSVDDLAKAKDFYTKTLGLELTDEEMGLTFKLTGGNAMFVYDKPNHEPANYTMLNFVVDDIDEAVEELTANGVSIEHYDNPQMPQDEKGIARGIAANMGPDIAWFKDPAGNILSVLQNS